MFIWEFFLYWVGVVFSGCLEIFKWWFVVYDMCEFVICSLWMEWVMNKWEWGSVWMVDGMGGLWCVLWVWLIGRLVFKEVKVRRIWWGCLIRRCVVFWCVYLFYIFFLEVCCLYIFLSLWLDLMNVIFYLFNVMLG